MKKSSLFKYCTVISLLAGICPAVFLAGAPAVNLVNTVPKAAPAKAAPAKPVPTPAEIAKQKIQDIEKRKYSNIAAVKHLKEIQKDTAAMADPQIRLLLYNGIVRYAQFGHTTASRSRDVHTIAHELEPAALAILNDPEIPNNQKFFAANNLVGYYCVNQKFDEAKKIADQVIAFPDLQGYNKAKAYDVLVNMYRYQDNYKGAVEAAREMMKHHKHSGAQKGAKVALDWENIDDIHAFWDAAEMPYNKYQFFQQNKLGHLVADAARAYAMDSNNTLSNRWQIAYQFCMDDMKPENEAVRKSLAGAAVQLKVKQNFKLKRAFQLGDYPLTVSLCELYEGSPVMDDLAMQKVHVSAMAACGKHKEAAALAARYGAREDLSKIDKMRFRFYEAILKGKSTDGFLEKSDLSLPEQTAVCMTAVRQTLTWGMDELAEKYSKQYSDYFLPVEPTRTIKVRYFDTPVPNITSWRKIYPELEKQYCDRTFGASTKYAAVEQKPKEELTDEEKRKRYLELTALCDYNGLHLFLRKEMKNSYGMASGSYSSSIITETYFAPGVNEPYTCIGTGNSPNGITFLFHTSYDHRNHSRLNPNDPTGSFWSEVEATETDYVLHLFFSWKGFYNKLPENGTNWRFECLSHGLCWAGSRQLHAQSSWGNLCFELTQENIAAIKKRIIFSSFHRYQKIYVPGTSENIFAVWQDPELGDPDFYQNVLKKFRDEVYSASRKIRKDMSAETIEEIYPVQIKSKEFSYEIDELRRRYLLDRLIEQGK